MQDRRSDEQEEKKQLKKRIEQRTARLGVIGLGYVGLPLAVGMAQAGFQVTGLDVNPARVDAINTGDSYVLDVPGAVLSEMVEAGRLQATQSLDVIEQLDAISICVPTPLRKSRDPDLSYILAAVQAVGTYLKPGQLIVLESTTYPGTTKEVVLPVLESAGLKVGKDFFLAFSPERVDPGNPTYNTQSIPKVIGGVTSDCTELAVSLYQKFIEHLVPVSSPSTAEMVKLLENTFRSVNIALANEMATLCQTFGINVWEVIDAAKTKPFGFMPFYPGPGLGGHCIPIDPHYLTWKARMTGAEPRLIELAGQINSQMPSFTVSRIADALNGQKKSLNGSKILALGVAYKRDVNDIRESPALEVLVKLIEKGSLVSYADPYVPTVDLAGQTFTSRPVCSEALRAADCVVVLTDHSSFDYSMIAVESPLIVDCRNALRGFAAAHIFRL